MNWIENRSTEETLVILRDLSDKCASLGGPVARYLNSLAQVADWKALLDYEFDYGVIELRDAIQGRQIQAFFSKLDCLPLGLSKRAMAVSRFFESERICLEANRTIMRHRRKPSYTAPDVTHALLVASQKICSILGPVPALEELSCAFGPGANTNVKGAVAMPRAKLSAPLACSSNMSPTVARFLEEVPLWTAHHCDDDTVWIQTDSANDRESESDTFVVPVTVVPGKLMFVPKNAKTDRSIVVEPLLNSFFQKGFGSYMRDRLLRFGVNLRDQSRNQRLAAEGSQSQTTATLDFSMASDCIAVEAVHLLLPAEWAEVLSQLRTSEIQLNKRDLAVASAELGYTVENPLRLEKFSSMGNGYTFELESVIFYGLALACCDVLNVPTSDVSVYGDDVILPISVCPLFEKTCSILGFKLNSEKSFSEGPFRESCGADYLRGFDIRPFYQKSLISDQTLFCMYNWMVRHGEYELALVVKQHLATKPIYGPDGFGDGHLIGDFPHKLPRHMRRAGYEGSVFETYTLKPRRVKAPMRGDRVLPAYSVYTRSGEADPTDPDVVRGSRGYAKISIYTLRTSIF